MKRINQGKTVLVLERPYKTSNTFFDKSVWVINF